MYIMLDFRFCGKQMNSFKFDYAVLPVILEHSSFLICTWFGTFVSIFSLGCAGAIAIFDQLIGSKEKVVPPSKEEEKEEGSSDSIEMAISLKQRAMSISRNDLDSGSSSVEKRLAITIPSQSRSMRSPLSPTIVFSTNSPMVSPTLVFKTGPWYNQLMPEGISTLPESFWLLTISFIR